MGGADQPTGREGSGQRSGDDAPSIAILFASRVVAEEEGRKGVQDKIQRLYLGCRIMVKLFDVLKVQRMQIFRQPGKSPLAWPGTAGTRQRDSERMEMEREAPLRILKPSGPTHAKEGGGAGEQ